MDKKRVCIFSSSSNKIDNKYKQDAKKISTILAENGYDLVFGGGSVGLMGVCAEVFKTYNREVISVIPKALNINGVVFYESNQIIVTETINERKAIMEKLADVFVALPGGFGTLEELLEVITLKQLGYHNKPICIFNTNNFFKNLLKQLNVLYKENFTHYDYKKIYFVTNTPEKLLKYINSYTPAVINKIFI